jgi:hypothetical protein
MTAPGPASLRREIGVGILTFAALAAGQPLDQALFPGAGEKVTPVGIAVTLACSLGHAMWISMDRRRRGHNVGAWRYFAILLGPLAVVVYLILEYRGRGVLGALVYAAGLTAAVLLGGAAAYGVFLLQTRA